MSATPAPPLFGGSAPATAAVDACESNMHTRTLPDLLYDGFFILFQLHNSQQLTSTGDFLSRVHAFPDDLDRGAKRLNVSAENMFDTKYAFCVVMDETILSSSLTIRPAWEHCPLQLALSGEQLADETFFVRLEELRVHGAPRLQTLEVFHICLLLSFCGEYVLEGPEKLAYLTVRPGDKIFAIRDKRAASVPHWPLSDKVARMLKCETPLWIFDVVSVLTGLLGSLGLSHTLNAKTNETLEGYSQVIKLGPRSSYLTTSLS